MEISDEANARFNAEWQTYVEEVLDALHKGSYTCTKCGRAFPLIIPIVVPNGASLKILCEDCIKDANNKTCKRRPKKELDASTRKDNS
jgi:hypothetical protein